VVCDVHRPVTRSGAYVNNSLGTFHRRKECFTVEHPADGMIVKVTSKDRMLEPGEAPKMKLPVLI
jgi:hypothetical protein